MPDSDLIAELLADATLDNDIQFPRPLSSNSTSPQHIFLTGATGFLGAYLLFELLQQTSANIHCLVRANNNDDAYDRLQHHLQEYQLWQAEFQPRIIPIVGDLSASNFSLSEPEFQALASKIDVIYHNAAQVNTTYSYSRLKDSNVGGTNTILRLAGSQQTKPLHFVSTLAVFFTEKNQDKSILEHHIPLIDETLKGGYKQSKWVAEALIRAAQARGLPASIYRPGRIWGDSNNPIMGRFSDLLCNLVQGGIHLKRYPDVNAIVNIAPVDYVSQAIVNLSLQTRCINQAYHLNNPTPLDWNKLWESVQSLGYPVEKTSFDNWKDLIREKSRGKEQKRLYLVLRHLLQAPLYLFSQKPEFDTQNTQAHLTETTLLCPTFNQQLLQTYLNAFQKSGYLPALANLS